jgi:hypothetical protein
MEILRNFKNKYSILLRLLALNVDTSQISSRDYALQIKEFVENNPNPHVFKKLAAKK